MREKTIHIFRHMEITGLYLLFFFLPFLKVPKNIGAALLILGAVGWRIADKSVKVRKPDALEWMLLTIFSIALASTLANWPFPKGINGLKDTLNYTMIAWVLYKNTYSEKQIKSLLWLAVSGAVIGLGWGYWEWKTKINHLFEFRRMMVAETSIITGMLAAALSGVLFDSMSTFRARERFLAVTLSTLFMTCIYLMGNRSGLLGFTAFVIMILLKFITNKRTLVIASAFLMTFFISGYIFTSGSTKNRINHLLTTRIDLKTFDMDSFSNNDRFRFAYWRLALAQSTQGGKLLLGVGPRNFPAIDADNFSFDPPLFKKKRLRKPCHAHNMYLTKLCEEGLLGLMALLSLWTYTGWLLFRSRPKNNQIHWTWIACVGAIVIPAIAGTFYAPFRREVAWISMMFLGLAANRFQFNRIQKKQPERL